MAVTYKSIEFRLHEYLVQTQDILTLLDADKELLDKINENKELIKTKKYRVAVMGEFKRGKSSLINALLGFKILPADVEPATATINRITYGTELKAIARFKDGTDHKVDVAELADYVTKLTPDGASRAAQIKEAVVYTPTVICQNHVDIIDTPGLNDNEAMTKITIDMLNNVDAVVVAIHARFPFGETERDFVCQLIKSDNINNIVFVVTFLDTLDEDDYVYENFMQFIRNRIQTEVFKKLADDDEPQDIIYKAHSLLESLHIFGISSSLALKYFITNDRKAFEKSRFDVFKTELMQIVTAKQVENAVKNTVLDIKSVLSNLEGQRNKKINHFNGKMAEIDDKTQIILDFCSIAGRKLSALFTAEYSDIDNAINSLNKCKNILVSEFIKALSRLQSDSHSAIESALSSASFEQYEAMNKTYLNNVKKELCNKLNKINKDCSCDKHDRLHAALKYLNIYNDHDFAGISTQIITFYETAFSGISFNWVVSPIPNVPNLSNCNVIEYVIESVDISINTLIGDLNNAMDKSREFMFAVINKDAENTRLLAIKAGGGIKRTIDDKSKAYTSNYTIFAETAKDIISNSEAILNELNLG